VQELRELQRQGMSIRAISELTGWDHKTIRKYMQAAGVVPEYGPRAAQPSKLDVFKPYLEERLRAGCSPPVGGDGYNFERNSCCEMAENFVGFASHNPALCTVGERWKQHAGASVFSIACCLRAGRRDLDRDVTLFDDEADIVVGRRGVRRPGSAEE
jgi:hypothetical protein